MFPVVISAPSETCWVCTILCWSLALVQKWTVGTNNGKFGGGNLSGDVGAVAQVRHRSCLPNTRIKTFGVLLPLQPGL